MKAHFSVLALLTVSLTSASAWSQTAAQRKPPKAKPVAAAAAMSDEPTPVVPAPPNSHPMEDLKKSHVKLQKLIGKGSPSWSPENDAKTKEIRQLVNSFLDFQELAQRSLAKHWSTIDVAKRRKFVGTLRELVERNYIDQMMGGKANYKLVWHDEDVKETEATVTATLSTTARGKPVNVEMEYRLVHKQNGWVVYDVVTDEQSLLETYRAEFNKVIKKESFDALLAKLEQKLDEKKQGGAKKK